MFGTNYGGVFRGKYYRILLYTDNTDFTEVFYCRIDRRGLA